MNRDDFTMANDKLIYFVTILYAVNWKGRRQGRQ